MLLLRRSQRLYWWLHDVAQAAIYIVGWSLSKDGIFLRCSENDRGMVVVLVLLVGGSCLGVVAGMCFMLSPIKESPQAFLFSQATYIGKSKVFVRMACLRRLKCSILMEICKLCLAVRREFFVSAL